MSKNSSTKEICSYIMSNFCTITIDLKFYMIEYFYICYIYL